MKKLLIIPILLISCTREQDLEKENETLKKDIKECGYMLYETEKIIQLQEADLAVCEHQIDSLTKLTKRK